MRRIARRWLEREPGLQGYPAWVRAEIVREKLLELLDDLQHPELFLVLETVGKDPEKTASNVEWKHFRSGTRMWSRFQKATFRGTIEDGVANLYLAHLAQWCQGHVRAADGSIVAPNDRAVLDPGLFVEYLENEERRAIDLIKIIELGETTILQPGEWRNRREILKWQASLALRWKRRN